MARVSDVQPLFDPETRRFKVRLETDNPGLLLRPDMFVDIELPIAVPGGISLPRDAVLDSGTKKTVFVDCGNGNFEPRVVETGWRIGERVQIISGVRPGERVVIAGNFLLDSESRTKFMPAPAAATVVAQKTGVSEAGAKAGAPR
jgi:Cu(I)/Ag(I) efflux system membrane fusion protein